MRGAVMGWGSRHGSAVSDNYVGSDEVSKQKLSDLQILIFCAADDMPGLKISLYYFSDHQPLI